MFNKIKNWFKKQINVDYYLVEVMPRTWYENRNVGGMRITLKFVKTIKQFGKVKTITQKETFNNYHDIRGNFMYNPPYVPNEDAHTEDELWHSILVWRDCKEYPFCKVSTPYLQRLIDEWIEKNKIECNGQWKT